MPLARLERTRETLPTGYQFGDARSTCDHDWRSRKCSHIPDAYYAVCETCGERAGVVDIRGIQTIHGFGWFTANVIEGEPIE